MAVLLDMLEEYDFYVRFHVVSLLATLVLSNTDRLQECILTSPMGMSRLMALLDDRREIIRNGMNLDVVLLTSMSRWVVRIYPLTLYLFFLSFFRFLEGLLLLISLTESNADLQKIVAFENAFERLLAIIDEEGAISGGIIVQDCLQLVQNLLRYNVSNQVRRNVFVRMQKGGWNQNVGLVTSTLTRTIFCLPPIELFPRDKLHPKDPGSVQ